jgi:hypothetical protein
MQLHSLATFTGDATYYTDGYRRLVESHYRYFIEQNYLSYITVDGQTAGKYHGDLYGLLDTLHIPKQHHWAVLFFNRYRHPGDYDQNTLLLLIPDTAYLDLLLQVYKTRKRLL